MYFCLEPKVSCGPVIYVIRPRPGANLRLIYVTAGAVTEMVSVPLTRAAVLLGEERSK